MGKLCNTRIFSQEMSTQLKFLYITKSGLLDHFCSFGKPYPQNISGLMLQP